VSEFFHTRVKPFPVSERATAAEIVERMAATSFQARNLAQAVRIWSHMLEDEVTILFGLAGAMVPAGMRSVIVYLIENRLVDCIVSTGANLFHDVYETLGKPHWQGSPELDDVELGRRGINRFYDVLAPETTSPRPRISSPSLPSPWSRADPTPPASTSSSWARPSSRQPRKRAS